MMPVEGPYRQLLLDAADLPAALALQPAPVLVVGPRDGERTLLGRRAAAVFRGRRVAVLPAAFSGSTEPAVLDWLAQRT